MAFLDRNGWVLVGDQDETYEFLLEIGDHKLTNREGIVVLGSDEQVLLVAKWLQSRIRKVTVHERPVQFRYLREILLHFGCELEPTRGGGSGMNIWRGALQTQVNYHGEGTEVVKRTIHKIRKDLELDEAHGYDSDIFYNFGPRIPEFINKYRKLLDRLAKE